MPNALPSMCQEDIVVDGNIYRLHAGHDEFIIKIKTRGDGKDNGGCGYGGWAFVSKFQGSEKDQALEEWRDLYNRRDLSSVAVSTGYSMEIKSSTPPENDTVALLKTVADQINTDFAEYKEHEKEATTLMLKLGLMVEAAKQNLKHGQLQKWMHENTELSYRHAHRFHKLAKIFIEVRQLKAGEAFALVDPANSEAALSDKLQQMAFEFLGDKTQAELLAEHGIAVRDAKKKGGDHGGGLARANDTRTHEEIEAAIVEKVRALWFLEMQPQLKSLGLEDMSWARLDRVEIQALHSTVQSLADKMLKHINLKDRH